VAFPRSAILIRTGWIGGCESSEDMSEDTGDDDGSGETRGEEFDLGQGSGA
jgi:hypothetical protein